MEHNMHYALLNQTHYYKLSISKPESFPKPDPNSKFLFKDNPKHDTNSAKKIKNSTT